MGKQCIVVNKGRMGDRHWKKKNIREQRTVVSAGSCVKSLNRKVRVSEGKEGSEGREGGRLGTDKWRVGESHCSFFF